MDTASMKTYYKTEHATKIAASYHDFLEWNPKSNPFVWFRTPKKTEAKFSLKMWTALVLGSNGILQVRRTVLDATRRRFLPNQSQLAHCYNRLPTRDHKILPQELTVVDGLIVPYSINVTNSQCPQTSGNTCISASQKFSRSGCKLDSSKNPPSKCVSANGWLDGVWWRSLFCSLVYQKVPPSRCCWSRALNGESRSLSSAPPPGGGMGLRK